MRFSLVCTFAYGKLHLRHKLTSGLKGSSQFIAAYNSYAQQFQSAYGVWQIVEFDLSSGAAPTSTTKQQLQYVVNSLGAMTSDLSMMAKFAGATGSQQIVSDMSVLQQAHYNALASVKALLSGILSTGQVDYQAVANTSNHTGTMERVVDCIRREIQVITGGK